MDVHVFNSFLMAIPNSDLLQAIVSSCVTLPFVNCLSRLLGLESIPMRTALSCLSIVMFSERARGIVAEHIDIIPKLIAISQAKDVRIKTLFLTQGCLIAFEYFTLVSCWRYSAAFVDIRMKISLALLDDFLPSLTYLFVSRFPLYFRFITALHHCASFIRFGKASKLESGVVAHGEARACRICYENAIESAAVVDSIRTARKRYLRPIIDVLLKSFDFVSFCFSCVIGTTS